MNKLLFALLLPAAACTSSSPDTSISSVPLAGTVEGQPWTFKAGATDSFLSDSKGFFTDFYATAFTACTGQPPSGSSLIVNLPKQPGTYPMSLSQNMTFTDGMSDNKIATEGTIRIDTVTATQITGGLHGIYDGNNEVNGTFTVTICPPMQ